MGTVTIGGPIVAPGSCCRQQLGDLVYDEVKFLPAWQMETKVDSTEQNVFF